MLDCYLVESHETRVILHPEMTAMRNYITMYCNLTLKCSRIKQIKIKNCNSPYILINSL